MDLFLIEADQEIFLKIVVKIVNSKKTIGSIKNIWLSQLAP